MPVLDSYAIGSCFRSTIARANWWPMPAAASMVPSRGTCSRQTSASRRWSLISIVPLGEAARWAIVVEGFFDCLRVHQAGYRNVVALMGASLSEVQEKLLLERFAQLVVMLDGDEAGRRASQQLVARLSGRVSLTRVVVPSGGQPDQLSNEEIEWILCGASGAPGA